MQLYTSKGVPLNNYYRSPVGLCGDNNAIIRPDNCGFSPYEIDETVYYLFKHLALPGIAAVGILIIIFLRLFSNFMIRYVRTIFLILAILLFLSVGRELIRAWKYKIRDDVIFLPGPYILNRKAEIYTHTINNITRTKCKIGFVGDIMKMKKFDLKFHPDICCFFNDVNLIIGNLEGIISDKSCPITKQAHPGSILKKLASLLNPNAKWLLCSSNNHSEDFGSVPYNHSLHRIQSRSKFDVFGRDDVSFIHSRNNDINIFSATEWSNQKTWDYTLKYNYPNLAPNPHDNNKFNILFPHWGFENEKYVRARVQSDARALLTGKGQDYTCFQHWVRKRCNRLILPNSEHKWDIIFAHHSHVLQPIIKVPDVIENKKGKKIDFNKLAVFSAGNFTSGANIFRKKKHISGIVMKCEIGPLEGFEEKLVIGKMEWRRTKNHKIRIDNVRTKRVCFDCEKYRTYNHSLLISSIFSIALFLLAFLFN
ncbi:MAG: CapA family protein [Promethearchaeota archaeon]